MQHYQKNLKHIVKLSISRFTFRLDVEWCGRATRLCWVSILFWCLEEKPFLQFVLLIQKGIFELKKDL